MESGGTSVIHRKARASREEYQARAMSPAKALRLALAQASDTLLGLPMVVAAVEQVEISQTALRAEFAQGGLMVLLDGPKGARGAVRLDEALLAALIEIQTTGRVTGRGTGGRTLTRTDAAMAAPLIDAAMAGAEAKLAEDARGVDGAQALPAPPHWAPGLRFGVMMDDARGMSLALGAPAYHVFRMMVEAGDDGYPGAVTFLLPVPEVPRQGSDGKAPGPQRTLEHSAMNAPVSLEAVLGRVVMPLDQVCAMDVGMLVPLPLDAQMQVRLETGQKHVAAIARLGQINGVRAARLMPDPGTAPRTAQARGVDGIAAAAPAGAEAGVQRAAAVDTAAGRPVAPPRASVEQEMLD